MRQTRIHYTNCMSNVLFYEMHFPALFLYLALILFSGPIDAAGDAGRVVYVQDGDTLTLLDPDKRQHRIRIAGIGTPEKAQPFGNRSRQNLASMVHGQEAIADCLKTDRYGRKVCKVWVQPSDCPTCGKRWMLVMPRSA